MPPQTTATEAAAAANASSSEAEVVYPIGRLRRRLERRKLKLQSHSSSQTSSPPKRVKSSGRNAPPKRDLTKLPIESKESVPAAPAKRKRKQASPPPWPDEAQDLKAAAPIDVSDGSVRAAKPTQPKRRRGPKVTNKEASPSSSQRSPLPKRRRNGSAPSEASPSPKRHGRKKSSKKKVFSADDEDDADAKTIGVEAQIDKENDPFAKWDNEEETIMKMSESDSGGGVSEMEAEVAGDAWDTLLVQRRVGSRKGKRGAVKATSTETNVTVDKPVVNAPPSQRPSRGRDLFNDDDDHQLDDKYDRDSSSNIDDDDDGGDDDDDDDDDSEEEEGYGNEFEDEEEVLEKARQYREALNKKIDLFHSQRQMLEEEVRLTRVAMEKSMLARMLFFISERLPLWSDTSEGKQSKSDTDLVVELPLILHHGVNLTVNDLTQRLWPLEASVKVWNEAPVSLQEAQNRAASIKTEISKRAEAARKWAISNALGYLASTNKNSFRLKVADVNERVASRFPQEYGELQRLVALDEADIAETQAVLKLINERQAMRDASNFSTDAPAECQRSENGDSDSAAAEIEDSSEQAAQSTSSDTFEEEEETSDTSSVVDKKIRHEGHENRGVQRVARRAVIESDDSDKSIRSPCKLTAMDQVHEETRRTIENESIYTNPDRDEDVEDDLPTPSPTRNLAKSIVTKSAPQSPRSSPKKQPEFDSKSLDAMEKNNASSRRGEVPLDDENDDDDDGELSLPDADPVTKSPTGGQDIDDDPELTRSIDEVQQQQKPSKVKKSNKRSYKNKLIKSNFIDQYAELSGEEAAGDEEDDDDDELDEMVKDGFITHDANENVMQGLGRINLLRQAQQEDLEEKQYKALFTMEGIRARRRRSATDDVTLLSGDEDEEDDREIARQRRRMGLGGDDDDADEDDEGESADDEEGGDDIDEEDSDWTVSEMDENEMDDIRSKQASSKLDARQGTRSRTRRASTSGRFRKLVTTSSKSGVEVVKQQQQGGMTTTISTGVYKDIVVIDQPTVDLNLNDLKELLASKENDEENC